MAGGWPSYAVQDMSTTPRTSGTIILTTDAVYFRSNLSTTNNRRYELCAGERRWAAERCRTGPFGMGATDTGTRPELFIRQGT